jgi:hypothetical protein
MNLRAALVIQEAEASEGEEIPLLSVQAAEGAAGNDEKSRDEDAVKREESKEKGEEKSRRNKEITWIQLGGGCRHIYQSDWHCAQQAHSTHKC